jgi:hypothetical protein
MLIFLVALAAIAPVQEARAQTINKTVVVDCGDGRRYETEVSCSPGQVVVVEHRCSTTPQKFETECTPPSAGRTMYFTVGVSGVYLAGTSLGERGSGAPEANLEFAFPAGKLRWLQILGQASFGGGDGILTGSGSLGLGFVLGRHPDLRPRGSTRIALLFTTRGRGTGDSQDFLTLGGKIQADVSLGTTAAVQWNAFLAFEAGGAIYKDGDGTSQNDGWYVAPSLGVLLRL